MDEIQSTNVVAIVVTFNRKNLLKECIEALLKQTYDNLKILIVDNNSNDGTYEYIQQYIDSNKIFYVNTGKNIGGAGGFNFGIKEAYKMDCEYMWLMDDDTIPNENALEELVHADNILNGNYGFLASSVLWKDGAPCLMNRQRVEKNWYNSSQYLKEGILKIEYSTFVSLFVKNNVVKEMGLPIKEFFIWGDDIEYTTRISKKMPCYIVGQSQVIHKTNNNEGSNISKDSKERINRYKYAYRNEVYTAKKNGIKGIIRQCAKICLHIFRVLVYSKKYKLKKIRVIIGSSLKGIFFNPKIEYIEKEV